MFKAIFSFFIPSVNDTPQERARHRLILSLGVTALTIFALGAMGAYQKIGIGGFAHSSEMKEMRIDQLDDKIENAVKGHCLAATQDSKIYYYEKLKIAKRKYQKVDGKYDPPTCKDLGVRWIEVFPQQP